LDVPGTLGEGFSDVCSSRPPYFFGESVVTAHATCEESESAVVLGISSCLRERPWATSCHGNRTTAGSSMSDASFGIWMEGSLSTACLAYPIQRLRPVREPPKMGCPVRRSGLSQSGLFIVFLSVPFIISRASPFQWPGTVGILFLSRWRHPRSGPTALGKSIWFRVTRPSTNWAFDRRIG
jgi:hypothetical protein